MQSTAPTTNSHLAKNINCAEAERTCPRNRVISEVKAKPYSYVICEVDNKALYLTRNPNISGITLNISRLKTAIKIYVAYIHAHI